MDIKKTQEEIYATAVEKGWYDEERSFGDVIALVISELSEAYEEYRKGYGLTEIRIENGKPEGIPVEMADATIRLHDWFESKGINGGEVMRLKMDYNKTRPYRHGGKKT